MNILQHIVVFALTLLGALQAENTNNTQQVAQAYDTANHYQQHKTNSTILDKVQRIPTFRQLYNEGNILSEGFLSGALKNPTDYQKYRLVSLEEFERTLDLFFDVMHKQLQNKKRWFESSEQLNKLLNKTDSSFIPFAQKMVVPAGTTCMCKGDLHGDFHSLAASIKQLQKMGYIGKENPLKIVDPSFYLIFPFLVNTVNTDYLNATYYNV